MDQSLWFYFNAANNTPGLSTVVQMLESGDVEIVCIGCECLKILLNSDKCDYRQHFIRKGWWKFLKSIFITRNWWFCENQYFSFPNEFYLIQQISLIITISYLSGVPQNLTELLCTRSEGNVLFCVLTTLSELCLAWSCLHPIPATQVEYQNIKLVQCLETQVHIYCRCIWSWVLVYVQFYSQLVVDSGVYK